MYEQPDDLPSDDELDDYKTRIDQDGEEDVRRNWRAKRVLQILDDREARRLADALEQKDRTPPVRRSLAEELELPDDEEVYAIDGLLPLGGNALFAGRYKAGKTTFNANALKSWADGGLFLGRYQCNPDPERPVVTIFNYEMSEGQFRRWLRRFNIRNTHLINVVHLRGNSLPFALPEVRQEIAHWLRDARTGLWIIDPASRAMIGCGDSDNNGDVNVFTGYIDEIKRMSGTRDCIMNIHMGHAADVEKNAERAMGAQAWSAWADALWFLTKDKDDNRWFRADGRDVAESKLLVRYDEQTMSVQLVETDPERVKIDRLETAVLQVIAQNPGINARQLRREVPILCSGARAVDIDSTRDAMIDSGEIVVHTGSRREQKHYLKRDHPHLEL